MQSNTKYTQLLQYRTSRSGAYIFRPQETAELLSGSAGKQPEGLVLHVTKGPLLHSLQVFMSESAVVSYALPRCSDTVVCSAVAMSWNIKAHGNTEVVTRYALSYWNGLDWVGLDWIPLFSRCCTFIHSNPIQYDPIGL